MAIIKCPVIGDLRKIQVLQKDLVKTLRQLRKNMENCKNCPKEIDCPVLEQVNSQIRSAIEEVNQEWDERRNR